MQDYSVILVRTDRLLNLTLFITSYTREETFFARKLGGGGTPSAAKSRLSRKIFQARQQLSYSSVAELEGIRDLGFPDWSIGSLSSCHRPYHSPASAAAYETAVT
jgi:hypothetical protein